MIPVTAECVLSLTLKAIRSRRSDHRDAAMDAAYFRDKAETCLRLAKGLSWNNPARDELTRLADEFQRQAEELEISAGAEQRPAC